MSHDFEALATFVEVADRGSFTQAAQRLGVSKSIVSRRVSRLEAELHARLLHRTTRGLALTEEGAAFHERCRTLLRELDDACEELAGRGGAVSGVLRLTTSATFSHALVTPVLVRLAREHPRLAFDVLLDDRRLDMLREGFDVAIRAGRLEDSTLIARPLAQITGVIVGSPDYLQQRGVPQHPDDLLRHTCLEHGELRPRGLWRFRTANGDRPAEFEQRLSVNNFEALRTFAAAGLGLAVMPLFDAAPALASGALVRVLADHEVVPHQLSAIYMPARRVSSKLRVLLDALVAYAQRPQSEWGSPA